MSALPRNSLSLAIAAALGVAGALTACSSGDSTSSGPGADRNHKPSWVGTVTQTAYDGGNDDLLTAGLGKSGLAGAAPTVANPAAPTAAELRRLAIYNNYRAIVDTTAGGGYGTLYGPNVDTAGNDTLGEGKIAGTEYLAYADVGNGKENVTMLVQVPARFDPNAPCIVSGTSSGSRGVYGAIGSAGEWGLKRNCAVAYTDKGTGTGVHDLQENTVNLINGLRSPAASAGKASHFTADLNPSELASFNAATPNRFAVKHAHSQQNPEKDWGRDTLRAIEFAFWVLNERYGTLTAGGDRLRTIKPSNTLVIASSVSNGAGAALAAAEQDTEGLIDGVAVTEPNVQLPPQSNLVIRRGSRSYTGGPKPLYDYFTYATLYQPCAALSTRAAGAPAATLNPPALATARCASLKDKGLLTAADTAGQAEEAMDKLLAYGWETESIPLQVSHYVFATPPIVMTYSNAYGRFSVKDNLCGLSFAAVDANGRPVPIPIAGINLIFGTSNGVPPTSGIQIINNVSVGGPIRENVSTSPSTGRADYNIDGAICQRNLFTGSDAAANRVKSGINEVRRTGNLRGKPAIVVHGRADTLIPVNFTSRSYFGVNKQVEGGNSKLSYIEVANGQHFDAFNSAIAGYDARFIPLHKYFNEAMDLMWAHLKSNAALPPSQLVRTTPRGGEAGRAPAITRSNVPPISMSPASGDTISYANNTVTIPE